MITSLFQEYRIPRLTYAGQISNIPEWKFPKHKHDDLSEIIYIKSGEGKFIIDNKQYEAKKGDILIFNKGIYHEEFSNPDNPLHIYFCGVSDLHIKNIESGCIIPNSLKPTIHSGEFSGKFEKYITDIYEEFSLQLDGYEAISLSSLICLITLIFRILSSQNQLLPPYKASQTLGFQIKEYIDNNFIQESSLNEIANKFYISPYYLSHVFKKETGDSIINYLINRKIEEAKILLMTTNLSVKTISKNVGYENSNYFSVLFKKITGESPAQFRKIIKQNH